MWLVLCASTDLPALWAYHGLARRGLAPLELVTADALGSCVRWEHRVDDTRIVLNADLADGRAIRSSEVRGTLNRVSWLPLRHVALALSTDREYATQEFTAFFMSWLAGLPGPVINQPTGSGLAGEWRHFSEWAVIAASCGLSVPALCISDETSEDPGLSAGRWNGLGLRKTVFAIDGTAVCGDAPDDLASACSELALVAGPGLFGFEFVLSAERLWTLVGVSPEPDLRKGGEQLLDRLYQTLQGGAS